MQGIPANSFRKVRIVKQYKRGIEKYVNKTNVKERTESGWRKRVNKV